MLNRIHNIHPLELVAYRDKGLPAIKIVNNYIGSVVGVLDFGSDCPAFCQLGAVGNCACAGASCLEAIVGISRE